MNKKEIVERSRRELAAADEGPWHVCEAESLDKNPSVGLPMVELIYRGGKGDEFKIIEIFGPDNDRGPANVKLIEHAHENLAACHAEIDRLGATVRAMRSCQNCKHGYSDPRFAGCSLDKYEECAESNEYSSWEAET
jgi:hypothetical protein